MAKKQAGAKKLTEGTTKATAPDGEFQAAAPKTPVVTNARTKTVKQNALPLPTIFFCMVIPFISLISSNEAPGRPFMLLEPSVTSTSPDSNVKQPEPAIIDPRILLVTAHPDDEILFAPTILSLLSEDNLKHADLWALTLSTGDYVSPGVNATTESQSMMRREEWEHGWETLGLSKDRRWILDVASLKDDPKVDWDAQAIMEQVLPFVWEHNINTILTFDDHGVTEHPNHRSIQAGMTRLISTLSDLEGPESVKKPSPSLYTLKTIRTLSNYGPLTPAIEHLYLGFSVLWRELRAEYGSDKAAVLAEQRSIIFISNWRRYLQTWKALLKHKSQMTPTMIALMVMGKYPWVNEWIEMV